MENLVILNDFMTTYVEHELIFYVSDYIEETYPKEDFDEQLNKYMECDYEDHLHYLVETWKKVADENVNVDGNFKIDYNFQSDFMVISNYLILNMPSFDYTWLHDIFEHKKLDRNILK